MSTYYTGNRILTREEMTVNAQYIYRYLSPRGWSINAICAMLGNMETESTINPGIWQNLDEGNTSMGFGLVQWTPATKYLEWCTSLNLTPTVMDSALKRIIYEVENGLQWIETDSYPLTFADFKVSTQDITYLTNAFLHNYERPAESIQPARATQALAWFEVLQGVSIEPTPKPIKQKKDLPLWLIVAATQRK